MHSNACDQYENAMDKIENDLMRTIVRPPGIQELIIKLQHPICDSKMVMLNTKQNFTQHGWKYATIKKITTKALGWSYLNAMLHSKSRISHVIGVKHSFELCQRKKCN